jgi:prephenate dehydrogenase
MAGHPEGGLRNARADLFCDKKWILCPQGSTPDAVDLVRDFVVSLGAQAVDLSVEAHDRSVAITSHLPQLLASALAVIAQKKDALNAAGPGFASATRVAGGAEEMWRDIFGTNAQEISEALIEISELLRGLGNDLKDNKIKSSIELLRSARRTREGTLD